MIYHPVVLFVYKRPDHTRRTLEALAQCRGASETDLIVFSDGAKGGDDLSSVEKVRTVCREAQGFRSVVIEEARENRGLATSVIAGVGSILEKSGACMVVEDDLIVAPGFLEFLNRGLEAYRDTHLVFSLSGYSPPQNRVPVMSEGGVWFAPRPSSWGWAVWKDRWDLVDWTLADRHDFFTQAELRKRFNRGGRDLSYFLRLQLKGQLDSWAVRFAWTQSKLVRLTLYPDRSFVVNVGLDGTGTHSLAQKDQGINLADARIPSLWPQPREVSTATLRRFRRHYEGTWFERWGHRWRKLIKIVTQT